MIAVVAPGQGAQKPGFLSPWMELPEVAERLHQLSILTGVDLVEFGTIADAETIQDTRIAQPLIVGAGIATFHALPPLEPGTLWAGHSVGELTALYLSGCLTGEDTIRLACERGRMMAEVSAGRPTGMSAVLGGEAEDVLERIHALGLTAANHNGAGQIVAAGDQDALQNLQNRPPTGSRVRPLKVAGAFHSEFMRPARERLTDVVEKLNVRDPAGTLLSNADGAVVRSGAEALSRIVSQITSPVRWDLTADSIARTGLDGVIELSPGGTLTGLLKRNHPKLRCVALRSPDDLMAAQDLLEEAQT